MHGTILNMIRRNAKHSCHNSGLSER